jgi:Tol biopolymer transport system component
MSVVEEPSSASVPRPPENRLDSWKAIASYLGRGVRTVQRWEREEGLPVHRLAHEKRGSVYGDKHEIDAWWESRRQTLSAETIVEPLPAPTPVKAERITWMSAATFWPAFSSDARLLAYVSDGGRDGALPQIWLHQVGGSATCLTTGAADRSHLAFSADDTRIIFTAADEDGSNVYSMPTLGGEPRLVKRGARAARPSPDGKWLAYIAVDDASGVRVAALDGSTDRQLAANLIDIAFAAWSPDSRCLLVQAHPEPAIEADYWLVPLDGGPARATGILDRLRGSGSWPIALPAAWIGNALVFSAITPRGVTIWRQRFSAQPVDSVGELEPLTQGTELDSFVTNAGARAAFVSTHVDQNLWSLAIDPTTGRSLHQPRRLTRGPGVVGQLSMSHDGRRIAYFLGGPRGVGIKLRDLETGDETDFIAHPEMNRAFSALSPSGRQLAFGTRSHGPRVSRPIFVASLPNGEPRQLGEDFGGRPRQWIDERYLLVERFGTRLLSVGVVDTDTGDQVDVLSSPDFTITNARVSLDARWIAFDAGRPGAAPSVYIAPFWRQPIPPANWVRVDTQASHPFWAADGAFVYYLPLTPSRDLRNLLRARRFDPVVGGAVGDPFTVFSSSEMVVPMTMAGAAPIAAKDQIVLALADFRGDIWAIDV